MAEKSPGDTRLSVAQEEGAGGVRLPAELAQPRCDDSAPEGRPPTGHSRPPPKGARRSPGIIPG